MSVLPKEKVPAFYSLPSGVCLKTCGNALSARALLELEELRGVGSGMFAAVLGPQCGVSTAEVFVWGTGWVLKPRCAAVRQLLLGRAHCAGTSAASEQHQN